MKQVFVSAAMLLGGFIFSFNVKSQVQNRSDLSVLPFANSPVASPTQIANEVFRFKPGITTHYLSGALPDGSNNGLTGFGSSDRWLSFGQVTASTQNIFGYRTQVNGRGLASGYSVPSGGTVSNPFIEWIGNNAIPTSLPPIINNTEPSGNLDFNFAQSPTGAAAVRKTAFTIQPVTNVFGAPQFDAFTYARANCLIGQLQNGTYGGFGTTDRWSATGQVVTPSFTTYGTRHQYEGYTYNTGFLKSGTEITAVEDFGGGTGASIIYKFRTFTNPTTPATIKNVWQSSNKFSNVVLGRQDYGAVNSEPFYLSLFDGQASNTSTQALSIGKAGIYVTTDGKDEFGGNLQSYASIIGEIENPTVDFGQRRFAIAGLTSGNATGNIYAGYFLGDAIISGTLFNPSDRKFKKQINDEAGILSKVMQLKPKNYFFDIEKFGGMAFSKKLQHGLISQEVEQIFPELVQDVPTIGNNTEKNETYKALNYVGLIPVLTKAIQELNAKVEELETKLANASTTAVLLKENTLSSSEKLVLENKAFSLTQNIPNPFTESTTISYTIPQNVNKALLAVFDLNGKMLLQFNLQQGKNQVIIKASQLAAGMYIYSLIANGQEVVSKRMVVGK